MSTHGSPTVPSAPDEDTSAATVVQNETVGVGQSQVNVSPANVAAHGVIVSGDAYGSHDDATCGGAAADATAEAAPPSTASVVQKSESLQLMGPFRWVLALRRVLRRTRQHRRWISR